MKTHPTFFLKTFSSLLISFITINAFAQVDPLRDFNKQIVQNWIGEYIRIGAYRVKGTPYLLGESFAGAITYKGGRTTTDKKLLYDIYNQIAGIDVNNNIWENDLPVETFIINLPEKFGGKSLTFKNGYLFNQPEIKGFLNVITDGPKVTFLKIYKARLLPDASNFAIKDLKVFEQYFDYYIFNKTTKQLNIIKLRKKDIEKELNNEEFLKTYLKNNNADLSNEGNVTTLINTYNNY